MFKYFLIFLIFGLCSVFLVGSGTEEKILSPVYQFGGLDIDAKHQLNKPADFIVTTDRIIVSDAGDDCLIVFDKKGRLIRRIGRQGQGPGEFNRPGKIGAFENKIIAFDTQNSRFQVFSWSGDCLKTYMGAPGILTIGGRLWYVNDNEYYFNSEGHLSDSLIILRSFKGDDIKGYGKIYSERTNGLDFGHKLVKRGKIPDLYKNRVFPVSDSEGNLYCIHMALPLVRKYQGDGSLIFEKTIELPEMKHIKANWIRSNKEAPPNMTIWLAYWRDVVIDDSDELLLLVYISDKMIIYRMDKEGNVVIRYVGVEDNISLIDIHQKELWAFGRDTHRFYKFIL